MTHTRVTTACDLQPSEIVRLDYRVIKVTKVEQGSIIYRGLPFPVAYVSGQSAEGEVQVTVPASRTVVAGH